MHKLTLVAAFAALLAGCSCDVPRRGVVLPEPEPRDEPRDDHLPWWWPRWSTYPDPDLAQPVDLAELPVDLAQPPPPAFLDSGLPCGSLGQECCGVTCSSGFLACAYADSMCSSIGRCLTIWYAYQSHSFCVANGVCGPCQ